MIEIPRLFTPHSVNDSKSEAIFSSVKFQNDVFVRREQAPEYSQSMVENSIYESCVLEQEYLLN
jgi:hypothetical protein